MQAAPSVASTVLHLALPLHVDRHCFSCDDLLRVLWQRTDLTRALPLCITHLRTAADDAFQYALMPTEICYTFTWHADTAYRCALRAVTRDCLALQVSGSRDDAHRVLRAVAAALCALRVQARVTDVDTAAAAGVVRKVRGRHGAYYQFAGARDL